ncbi:type II restriction/-modification system protein [Helicobacter mustelae]|uniref:DUF7149 domain-containing protein n=1 Tax=Helicobacter mustelae TaxID=217 RepID=UPI000DFEC2E9|nr:Eco57I restriction-modification methylase domain-containing protein [Helicobacter mustelae]STP11967.1 type II restriction/-modification system protein [Helicobacter mustelae]
MITFSHIPLEDFLAPHNPKAPQKQTIEDFEKELKTFLEKAQTREDEEYQKNEINKFLNKVYGYDCNTKGNIDSAIYVDNEAQVLIEVKALKNKAEFPKDKENPLSKALCEGILYFLREREKHNNNSIRHIILCNPWEFYVFDARRFHVFLKDAKIKKLYENCEHKNGTDSSTQKFYADLEKTLKEDFKGELAFTYFALKDDFTTEGLSLIYQLLSPEVLLKARKTLDANTLNQGFYEELLYLLGLEEISEGGKILIKPSKVENTLSNAITKAYELNEEEIFTLLTTWNNRILFLRLLESMLLGFKHIHKPFLDASIIKDFGTLQNLFFEVLAKEPDARSPSLIPEFAAIPYLNSSLFDRISLEREGKMIGGLYPSELVLFPQSILKKDKRLKDTHSLPWLAYLFEFLHAYDFTTTAKDITEGVKQNHDRLINSAVLGLVFEKLNGYKEGSFYTPSFITSYMCKEVITQALLDKFNSTYSWKCKNLKELREEMGIKGFREHKEEFFLTFLSLKICDPAVGSGHFLVSALNEMIQIAYTLKLIPALYESTLDLENDEILIKTNNELHQYTKPSSPIQKSHQIQVELFTLKKQIIENCLFGVDINPNSCEITKLRLWIELLKYSYYLFDAEKNTGTLETLPNIDINIKCGNSLISYFPLDSKLSIGQTLSFSKNLKTQIQSYKDSVMLYKEGLGEKNKILQDITKIQSLLISYLIEQKPEKLELLKMLESFVEDYGDSSFDISSDFGMEMLRLIRSKNFRFTPTLTSLEPAPIDSRAEKLLARIKKCYEVLENLKTSHAFEWRFAFPEVLDEEGNFLGFDAVIGNPPYIRIQGLDRAISNQYKKIFSSASQNYDIYVLFVEKCLKILSPNAQIAFIMPHKWLNSSFGAGLRELTKDKISKIISFGHYQIFEASTYTALQWFKQESDEVLYAQAPQEIATSEEMSKFLTSLTPSDFLSFPTASLAQSAWYFGGDAQQSIFSKITLHTPLKEIFSKIFQGIATSKDSVYFLYDCQEGESMTKGFSKELGEVVEIENDLLKPLLKGDSFHRYDKLDSDLRVIFPYFKEVDSKGKEKMSLYSELDLQTHFPKGYAYLKQCEQVLRARENGRLLDDELWWRYIYPKNQLLFSREKLLCPDICDKMQFAWDRQGKFYSTTTVYGYIKNEKFEHLDSRFLLAVLNSKLTWWHLSQVSSVMRGGFYRSLPIYMQDFCIPNLGPKEQEPFITLADKILKLKAKDSTTNTSALESEIDSLVYTLYNLTEEEIKIIEGEVQR